MARAGMAHAASAFNEVQSLQRIALNYRQAVGAITQTMNANFAARLKCE
jgi:hypothetical protein